MNKNMNNLELAEMLRGVAAVYTALNEDKNKFRITAYQRAADAVEHLSSEAKDIWSEGKLTDVAGIGEQIASHVGEIFEKGFSSHFEKIMKEAPVGMLELIKVSGIGPKGAYKIAHEFELDKQNPLKTVKELAKAGKIADLEGFGEESEKDILRGITEYENKPEKRMLISRASEIAFELKEYLVKSKFVVEAQPLGSLRRKCATIGDIDIGVATENSREVIKYFCDYPKKIRVIEKGSKTASILLAGGVQVDLLTVSPESFGSALQHFTGSKHHNIALRELALKRNLSLSEYGIKKNKKLNKFKTEKEFYKFLGLSYIEPELREDAGEIQAAKENTLPELVNFNGIKGDLQIHSSFDIETSHDLGEDSMEKIIEKANELGYEYVAFTEHNPSKSKHTNSEAVEILKRKREKIDKLNYSMINLNNKSMQYVFNSLEIDILPNGDLPVNMDGLDTLDFALVSIHSSFKQTKLEATKRILSALSHPKIKIFAHPTGRKINYREGVEFDWEKIFEFCLKNEKWIEINCDPMRLDLPDNLVHDAVNKGIKLTLGTDAHALSMMDNMRWGVSVARRGWATKKDIINTRTFKELFMMLELDA